MTYTPLLVWTAILAPILSSQIFGTWVFLAPRTPSEKVVSTFSLIGLGLSAISNTILALGLSKNHLPLDLNFGPWLESGTYRILLLIRVDELSAAFAFLAAILTWMIAHFSRTYLHKDSGYIRYFYLLGLFASGAQLVAYAGTLDLMFAGWETIGIASTLFIGFFHERQEPLRSSIRALVTYRICDLGFLLGTVATHEWLGTTEISALKGVQTLPILQGSIISALFLLSAAGKCALFPFSGWLARAMEGPTPSSALFYGGISIHVGLFLLLRAWPDLDVYPSIKILGIALGFLTSFYATSVANVLSDTKGKLAHATLAQVGLIFAEIAAGWTTLAIIHLMSHAFLRVWQYLRAPNILHDVHRTGAKTNQMRSLLREKFAKLDLFLYSMSLHRWRVDEIFDILLSPLIRFSRWISQPQSRIKL